MGLLSNVSTTSGDWDSDAAGTDKNGTAIVFNTPARLLADHLSAHLVVEAETNLLTIEARWQVSPDNSTFSDMPDQNNTAVTVLATAAPYFLPAVRRLDGHGDVALRPGKASPAHVGATGSVGCGFARGGLRRRRFRSRPSCRRSPARFPVPERFPASRSG